MLGSVDRFILTPIVLRFARKYIKDPEGAAVSDLHVSVSGGSVVFRNFELNLEEIVKDLPCSTVRAFARQLNIKIPWTKLATDPIEVVLDTVECVFAEGKQCSHDSKGPNREKPTSTNPTSASPGVIGEGEGGWMGSLLERALTNVTVRVNNIVCKYLGSGAVLTLSCQSVEIFSSGSNWERTFLQLEDGLRKRCIVRNISIALDTLTAEGKVDVYQDPLLRTSSFDLRFAFASIRSTRKQRCSLDVRLASWDASVSDQQIHILQQMISGFKSRAAQGDIDMKLSPDQKSMSDAEDTPEKRMKRSWFDYSSDDSDEVEESSQKPGTVGRVTSAGASMLGWAWNFLAEEDFGSTELENSDVKEAALRELGAAASLLQLNNDVEWLIQCRFEVGNLRCRSAKFAHISRGDLLSDLLVPVQTNLTHSPLLSPSDQVKSRGLGLVGTVVCENFGVVMFSNKEGLQAFTFRLSTFMLMQPPDRFSCTGDKTILAVQSSVRGSGDVENSHDEGSEYDLSAQFMSVASFTIDDMAPSMTDSTCYSEAQNCVPTQNREAVTLALWVKTKGDVLSSSKEHTHQKLAVHVGVGVVQMHYCPGLLEQWIGWVCDILKADQASSAGNTNFSDLPCKKEADQEQPDEAKLESRNSLNSVVSGDNVTLSTAEPSFLQWYSPFSLAAFQFTLDSSSINLLTSELREPTFLVLLRTGPIRSSLCPLGMTALAMPDGVGSFKHGFPAILLSASMIELCAGKRSGEDAFLQHVVFPFSIQGCVQQGGHASIYGLKGLTADVNIQDVRCSLRGVDCHAVMKVFGGLVPVCNLNLPPPSACEGAWIDGQISGINAKYGHIGGSCALRISNLILELFESRFELLSSDQEAGLLLEGTDEAIPKNTPSLIAVSCLKSLQIGLMRLLVSNQAIHLWQAILALNASVTNPTESKFQHSDRSHLVSREGPSMQRYQLNVAKMEILLIAMARNLSGPVSANRLLTWEGQMALCFPLTTLKLSVLLGKDFSVGQDSFRTNCSKFSLVGSLTQMQMLLGFVELTSLEMKDGPALRESYAIRTVGHHMICVSNFQGTYEQVCDSTTTTGSLCITEIVELKILDLLLNISRDHHVLLYKFAQTFCSLPPACLDQSLMNKADKNSCVLMKEVKTSTSINFAAVTIKLDLWRDETSSSLDEVMDNLSKVIFKMQDGSVVMNREVLKKEKFSLGDSLRDSIFDDGSGTPEYNYETIDKCKVVMAHLDLSTSRSEKGYHRNTFTSDDAHVVHTFPLIRQAQSESLSVDGPVLTATWNSGVQGLSNLIIEMSPLHWYIDSRLIEEIVTVCWERCKHIKPMAGVDVLPMTLNLRIVARAGCLHVVPLFTVLPTLNLVLTSDYFVVILDKSLGADTRQWAGVHDGQTPGVMDLNKLLVQNLDISLVNWKLNVLDPRFSSPATLLAPTDIRIVGKLLGCPGPILLSCVTQSFKLNFCKERLSCAFAVLGALLSGWSSSWPLRQQYESPPNFTDDLRSGLFQMSSGTNDRLSKGEVTFCDSNAYGGSLSWRYPFPRRITEILVSDQLFSEVPGLPEDTAVIFQLCYFDETKGVFMDAAPHLVAIGGESRYRIEPFMKVKAEEWRLTWFLPPGAIPTTPPNYKARLFPATTILKLLQVNPSTANLSPNGDMPSILPFMILDLKAEGVRFSLVHGWDNIELAAIQGTDFHVGFHFWTSGLYTLAAKGLLTAEYTDMATYTHELLMEPVSISIEVTSCSVAPTESSSLNTSMETENSKDIDLSSVGPEEVRPPPAILGYSLWVQTTGNMNLRIQKSFLQEFSRIADVLLTSLSPAADPQTDARLKPLQTGFGRLQHFAFTIKNSCPVNLAFRQAGSQELIEIEAGGSYAYAWRNPPKLSPTAERKLQIFCLSGDSSVCNEKTLMSDEKWWCEPIEVEKGSPQQRCLLLDSQTSICVVVQMKHSHSTGMQVTIRPSFQLTNMTAILLQVQIRGLFPSKFLAIFLDSVEGSRFEATSEEKKLLPYFEGVVTFPMLPIRLERPRLDIMFATQLVRQSGTQATVRVLVDGDNGWSGWAPLEDTRASANLLLKNDLVEWKRTGGLVPPSSPLVCLEHVRPESDSKGQYGLVFWPLFYIKNKLFQSLSIQVGLQGSDVVLEELDHDMEAPLNVTMSGRQYLVAKIGTSLVGGGGIESECCALDDTAGEALKRASSESTQVKIENENYKSKPILLTASIFRVRARFDISYQELPPVGSHDTLIFSSCKTGHSGFSCILRTSVYKEGLPTLLLSFLPMAILHNHYFLPVAVRDAWLPPDSNVAASASPGDHSAFALQGLPGQQCGRKISIGLGELNEQGTNKGILQVEKVLNGKSPIVQWVWSTSLEVETESIQEVTVGKGSLASHFLVRTRITQYNDEYESDACMCCHLTVYPVTLVSNFTGHTLRFVFSGTSGSKFWDYSDRTKLSPLAATGYGENENKAVVKNVGLLAAHNDVNTDKSERTLSRNGGKVLQMEGVEGNGEAGAKGLETLNDHSVSLVEADEYFWSEPMDLCKPVHQRQLMLLNDSGYAIMLIYSLGVVDKQYHILIQRDPQPPCIVLNNTEYPVEVRGLGTDSMVMKLRNFSRMDFDPEGLDKRDSEEVVDLDESFLSHMKHKSKTSSMRIRVLGHVWSEPLHLAAHMTMKYVGSLSGSMKLFVTVEQLGPTFYVHISPIEELKALNCNGLERKTTSFTHIRIFASMEKLRLSLCDDELRILRGPRPAGKKQFGRDCSSSSEFEEVAVITLDHIYCLGLRFLRESSIPGVPAVSVQKLLFSIGSLQVDMQLEDSELPVLISTASYLSAVSLQKPLDISESRSSSVMIEFCRNVEDSMVSTPTWLEEMQVSLMPLTVNIDNASFALARRLGKNSSQKTLVTIQPGTERGSEAGDAPDHLDQFLNLEPQFYVGKLQVERVKLLITLRIARPVILNTHQAPVVLASFKVMRSHFPLVVLVRGLIAHYTTQVVINTPGVLGSMDLLLNVTGLVKGIQAGVNDLLRLPLRGIQYGPHGFLFGLGAGGFSLVRHISVWTFSSIAGFASTLSQVLDSAYSDGPVTAPAGNSFSKGFVGFGQGVARGVSGIVLTPMRAANRGRSNFFLGVGKGLVGAVAGPMSGALQLVAHTSQGIVGTTGSVLLPEPSVRQDSADFQKITPIYFRTRSSRLRFEHQILRGTSERYVGHTEATSVIYTSGGEQSPTALQQPVLLLSDKTIRALEDGGTLEKANICIRGVEVEEDMVTRTLTIYGAEGVSLLSKQSQTMCDLKEGLQLYVQLEEGAWRYWVPLLREAVPRRRSVRNQ